MSIKQSISHSRIGPATWDVCRHAKWLPRGAAMLQSPASHQVAYLCCSEFDAVRRIERITILCDVFWGPFVRGWDRFHMPHKLARTHPRVTQRPGGEAVVPLERDGPLFRSPSGASSVVPFHTPKTTAHRRQLVAHFSRLLASVFSIVVHKLFNRFQ
jgi:hypothetical protein